jgi:hypothetical protein
MADKAQDGQGLVCEGKVSDDDGQGIREEREHRWWGILSEEKVVHGVG